MVEIDKSTGEAATDAEGRVKLKTSHTLNAVPCHVFAPGTQLAVAKKMEAGGGRAGLANLAATVLHLMGLEAPEDFEESLLEQA
jgi:2,3-bisphosphoglycerate-independent phosphoglycerate mutase